MSCGMELTMERCVNLPDGRPYLQSVRLSGCSCGTDFVRDRDVALTRATSVPFLVACTHQPYPVPARSAVHVSPLAAACTASLRQPLCHCSSTNLRGPPPSGGLCSVSWAPPPPSWSSPSVGAYPSSWLISETCCVRLSKAFSPIWT